MIFCHTATLGLKGLRYVFISAFKNNKYCLRAATNKASTFGYLNKTEIAVEILCHMKNKRTKILSKSSYIICIFKMA